VAHLDDVSAEIRQDHRSAGTGDEAREIHHFQSGEYIVVCHSRPFQIAVCGNRFTDRGTAVNVSRGRRWCPPSCLSVAAQMPKTVIVDRMSVNCLPNSDDPTVAQVILERT
jgi:hypothetical protein